MLVIKLILFQPLIIKKLLVIFDIYLSHFQNLLTIMKPSLVPRVPRDQGFCDTGITGQEIINLLCYPALKIILGLCDAILQRISSKRPISSKIGDFLPKILSKKSPDPIFTYSSMIAYINFQSLVHSGNSPFPKHQHV